MSHNVANRQLIPLGDLANAMPSHPLPETGYLRLHQIVGRPARNSCPPIPALIPVSRSTWWAGVKSGRYPQPVRTLGLNITVWRVEDVLALINPKDGADPEVPRVPARDK